MEWMKNAITKEQYSPYVIDKDIQYYDDLRRRFTYNIIIEYISEQLFGVSSKLEKENR